MTGIITAMRGRLMLEGNTVKATIDMRFKGATRGERIIITMATVRKLTMFRVITLKIMGTIMDIKGLTTIKEKG